ncbi:unnamed protein product, partial [Medioppia subpectinata]
MKAFNYWSDRNILGPKPIPIFGNFLSFFFKALPHLELEWYHRYGQLYGTFGGNKPELIVSEPALIKQVLVKDFHSMRNRRDIGTRHKVFTTVMFLAKNDDWKRIRAIASTAFTASKIKQTVSLIHECCDDFMAHLDKMAANETHIDLKQKTSAYTMDVIARCAFAFKTNTYDDPNHRFTTTATNIFMMAYWKIIAMVLLPTRITNIQAIRWLINKSKDLDFIITFARNMIQNRRNGTERYGDFLQLFLDVERTDDQTSAPETIDGNEAHHLAEGKDERQAHTRALANVSERKLTEDEIVGQCFQFFTAGFETTANTLAYCMYELALNPALQVRLRDETRAVIDGQSGEVDCDRLSRLPFIDALISETLRKYPPLLRLDREVTQPVQLGDTGFTVEKGVLIQIPLYSIHHNQDYYPQPFTFNPDRFMPENKHLLIPYTYLPFGAGPRNCIGMRFGLLELKLVLTKMCQRFQINRLPATDVPVRFLKGRHVLLCEPIIVSVTRLTLLEYNCQFP